MGEVYKNIDELRRKNELLIHDKDYLTKENICKNLILFNILEFWNILSFFGIFHDFFGSFRFFLVFFIKLIYLEILEKNKRMEDRCDKLEKDLLDAKDEV